MIFTLVVPKCPDISSFESSLSCSARYHLDKQLDWDNEGVDKDLYKIAENMSNWEERLACHLGLSRIDICDITEEYHSRQRRR